MRLVEFFSSVFYENIGLYFFSFFGVMILMIPIFRKYVHGILDPFFFILFMTVFAYVIPVFLYLTGNCSMRNFSYFIISESFFWLGFALFYGSKTNFSKYRIVNESILLKYIFYISFLIYVTSKIYTYLFIGIPLLMEYRLDLYSEANGLGILGRLSDFSASFLLIYSFHLKDKGDKKHFFIFILIFINSVLTGSKSAILIFFQSYFIYNYFYKGIVPKLDKKYWGVLLLFPIIILLLSASGVKNLEAAGLGFFVRMVANGDVFWYAYPNDVIDHIRISNPFTNFFVGILGPFRLIDYQSVEPSIGALINWEIEPSLYGTNAGSNARPAIAGWIYFKWYGVFFSFLLGCFVSFLIYHIRKYFPKGLLGVVLYGFLYQNMITFIIDPSLGFSYLSNFLINVIIYTVFIFFISKMRIVLVKNTL